MANRKEDDLVLPHLPRSLDRRGFVRTASGILVATAVGGCNDPDAPEPPPPPPPGTETGTLAIAVTGLTGGGSGGSATAVRTDVSAAAVTVPVPASGTGSVVVAVGTYDVTYAPPAGFQLASGVTNPQTLQVTANQTATATFTVEVISTGGTGSLSGVVALSDGTPVVGGVVEILDSAGAVATAVAVAAAGAYSVGGLTAGAVTIRLQPARGFCLGDAEPDTQSVTIVGGAVATTNFTVQPAILYDDFQSYSDTADLLAGVGLTAGAVQFIRNGNLISLDPTGGPNGGQVMRYDWPDRTGAGCTGAEFTLAVESFFTTPPPVEEIWVRFIDRMSLGWVNGDVGCTGVGASYKFLLLFIGAADPLGEIGLFVNGTSNSHQLLTRLDDRNQFFDVQFSLGDNAVWTDIWYTWLLHVSGIGTANARLSLFRDGVQIVDNPGSFQPGTGAFVKSLQLGANINNGPSQAQSRSWREVGLYPRRPDTRNGPV